jgi:carboxypeptidase Taq
LVLLLPTIAMAVCRRALVWCSTIGGGFQSYTIGNILSAQFYAAAIKTHPNIPREIAKGEFGTLHGWLREHLYQHGRKFQRSEVVTRATGGPAQRLGSQGLPGKPSPRAPSP